MLVLGRRTSARISQIGWSFLPRRSGTGAGNSTLRICLLNPKPQTPNPKPQTPNPKPQTLNLNPKNPKPWALKFKRALVIRSWPLRLPPSKVSLVCWCCCWSWSWCWCWSWCWSWSWCWCWCWCWGVCCLCMTVLSSGFRDLGFM